MQGIEPPRTSLEYRAKLVPVSLWEVRLYPDAAEAVGIWRPAGARPRADGRARPLPSEDTAQDDDARDARRARGKSRRYCVANRLNRLGTLTYAGEGQRDHAMLRRHVGAFFRRLRGQIGERFPYLWTAEWHKQGHGLHVHFAVGRFVHRSWLTASWPYGFVHIKLLGNLPARSGVIGESRAAARYLAKYIGKDQEQHPLGVHRYEVAQRFQPRSVIYRGSTEGEALGKAVEAMQRWPDYLWRSGGDGSLSRRWPGPQAVFASWD